MRLGLASLVLIIAVARSGIVSADEPSSCSQDYERAQILRRDLKLVEARETLVRCAQQTCPEVARQNCGQWLAEVERELPSVVFDVRDRGENVADVTVRVDGKVVAEKLEGKSVELDPGFHDFSFEISGRAPVVKRVLVREGVKNQELNVTLEPATPSVPAPSKRVPAQRPARAPIRHERTISPWTWAFGGLGVVALGSFGAFAATGYAKERDVRNSGCKPDCNPDDIHDIRRKYLIADLSLGVGVISFATAAVLLLTSGSPPRETASVFEF